MSDDRLTVAVVDPSGFTIPYDHHLCEALQGADCNVHLLTTSNPAGWPLKDASYTVERFFYRFTNRLYGKLQSVRGRLGAKGTEHILDMTRLAGRLRELNPDVIHFQWLPLPPVDQWFVPLFKRIAPVVYTIHDSKPFHEDSSSRLQLLGVSRARKRFDHCVVHTKATAAKLRANGTPTGRISVIPHGVLRYPVDTDIADRSRNTVRLLFFGAIKPYKGLDVLIRALGSIRTETLERVQLRVAGPPQMDTTPLRQLASEMGVSESIRWELEFVPHEVVSELFASSDVVVLPYRDIDQSGVLMSAVPFGRPIIASAIGGFDEILEDGTHGRLVPPDDPEALAKAIEQLADEPERRAEMGSAVAELGRTTHAWENIAAQTIAVYRTLL